MRKLVTTLGAILMALQLGAAPQAQAARTTSRTAAISTESFEPLHAQNLNILNIHGSEVLGHLNLAGGLFFHYSLNPLAVQNSDTGHLLTRLVGGRLSADLSLAIGLFDRIELGVYLPLALYQYGDSLSFIERPGDEVDGFALGDLRLTPKVTILDPDDFSGFGLAVAVPVYFPTGDSETFMSDRWARVMPQLILDWRHEVGFKIALNAGYMVRPERWLHNIRADDQIRLGLGLEAPTGLDQLRIQGAVHAALEVFPSSVAGTFRKDGGYGMQNSPVEADLALRFDPIPDVQITLGGGAGIAPAIASPDVRVFLGVGYSPGGTDTDGDGIGDADDACPSEAEDLDGFRDEDGCPDLDHDSDGIPDTDDRCPKDPEDADGFADRDGCPDLDNDSDRLPDTEDACPDDAEDRDGFEDQDGCPDPDNDGDGVADTNDRCPNEPEDEDDFEDRDGCPDPDNDGDGILDADDVCPTQPETMNGLDDEDGCPDSRDQKVKVTRESVLILEQVNFQTGKSAIKRRSHALLAEVAKTLADNPQLTLLRVEGHTDDRGRDEANQRLSQDRADAVKRFLVDAGIDEARLEAVGYGESRPIASNKTGKGRAKNRRVLFTVLELYGAPAQGAAMKP